MCECQSKPTRVEVSLLIVLTGTINVKSESYFHYFNVFATNGQFGAWAGAEPSALKELIERPPATKQATHDQIRDNDIAYCLTNMLSTQITYSLLDLFGEMILL